MNKNLYKADCIIIGAGIFGLYAAKLLDIKKQKVIILERSKRPFARASAINQARVHNGYHYPRSYETAKKVAYYYNRFNHDFSFAINDSFKHIYAISNIGSKTSSDEFVDFCTKIDIPLEKISSNKYFINNKISSAFKVKEPAFNFSKIRDYFTENFSNNIKFIYDTEITHAENKNSDYLLSLVNGTQYSAPRVINATYAGINNIIALFNQELFKLKYELDEIYF